MKLPQMVYADGIRKITQVKFGGYNHTRAAGDGELYDMENLTGAYYPLLASRKERRLLGTLTKPNGIFCNDGLLWVDGTAVYFSSAGYDVSAVSVGAVADSFKTFAALGARIVIFPDKKYYDVSENVFGALEASYTSAAGGVSFKSGTIYGETAKCNSLHCAAVDFADYFAKGDAVTVSGCATHTENNKTPIIREISEDGHTLRFYENTFVLSGDAGETDYTEPGAVTVARTVPDMDFLCQNENRVWGGKGDTVYACKQGDVFNWNVFDGISTDSYAAQVGSEGDLTGCAAFMGYPCFFKERHVYKVYGSRPSNYEIMPGDEIGVMGGAEGSLAVAGGKLFFLSPNGVCAYSGGMNSPIHDVFGDESYSGGVGGSDGGKYYISMQNSAGAWSLFAYETVRGLWHREDATHALDFARFGGKLLLLRADGQLLSVGDRPGSGGTAEGAVTWSAEFADFTDGSPDAKGVTRMRLRAELLTGASVNVYVKYDGADDWLLAGEYGTGNTRSIVIPVIPTRADRYRLKLTGSGRIWLQSLTREDYEGSML